MLQNLKKLVLYFKKGGVINFTPTLKLLKGVYIESEIEESNNYNNALVDFDYKEYTNLVYFTPGVDHLAIRINTENEETELFENLNDMFSMKDFLHLPSNYNEKFIYDIINRYEENRQFNTNNHITALSLVIASEFGYREEYSIQKLYYSGDYENPDGWGIFRNLFEQGIDEIEQNLLLATTTDVVITKDTMFTKIIITA